MVGLKSRVFWRKHVQPTSGNTGSFWADDTTSKWNWMGNVKSIPNIFGEANMVGTSGLEDKMETQEEGRRTANTAAFQMAWKYKDALEAVEGEEIDVLILYGSDGQGNGGAAGTWGSLDVNPDEITDEEMTITATLSVHVMPVWLDKDYTFAVTEDIAGYPTGISVSHS